MVIKAGIFQLKPGIGIIASTGAYCFIFTQVSLLFVLLPHGIPYVHAGYASELFSAYLVVDETRKYSHT